MKANATLALSVTLGCSIACAMTPSLAGNLLGFSADKQLQATPGGGQNVILNSRGRVASPRRYLDYPAIFELQKALRKQEEDDLAFARSSGTLEILEGPWETLSAHEVVYLGIDERGQRVRLSQISSLWHYEPVRVVLADANGTQKDQRIMIRPTDRTEPIVKVILLGRALPGMLIRSPDGIDIGVGVQSDGLLDGKDFYFRARDGEWSLSVGCTDVVGRPDWYHEESYGSWPAEGSISEDQAYTFIAKAAALYRSAAPSMQLDYGNNPAAKASPSSGETVVGVRHEGMTP